MSDESRSETMAEKLATYARRAGADPRPVVAAYELSVARRLNALHDVFHPDLLHPARTALILIQDAGCNDSALLAAATLCETEFAALKIDTEEIMRRFGYGVAELVAAVPEPGKAGERLLEELVTASEDVALLAVAERLDHARHLHFRDPTFWLPFFTQIVDVYLPVSGRVSGMLEKRLARWSRAFQKRL